MSDEQRRFRFDPVDHTGILLGLGVTQLAVLGVGFLAAAGLVTLGVPGPVAGVPLAMAAVVSFGRIGGWPATDVVMVAAGWAVGGRARRRWFAPLPSTTRARRPRAALPLPAPMTGLEIIEVRSPWHRVSGVGLVHDTIDGTLTTVVPVRGRDFALLERAEQDDHVARWGEVLATFARERGLVTRLAWTEFATPAGLGDHRRWLDTARTGPGPPTGQLGLDLDLDGADSQHRIEASYDQVIDGARSLTARHEVLVTLTVARSRLTGRRRHTGTDPLADAAVAATEALLRALSNAGVEPGDPLTPAQLAAAVHRRTDPTHPRHRSDTHPDPAHTTTSHPGPTAVAADWATVRADGAWHRCFWIAGWPRLPVHADWIEPLLTFTGTATRTLTVIHEPVAPSASRRRIDRDAVKLESDAAAREEKGRRVTAQHRRNQAAVTEREHELVAGYVEFDYLGLLTVTVADLEDLHDHCDRVDQVAREHGLELQALDGRHDLALAATLPLGLGPHRLLPR